MASVYLNGEIIDRSRASIPLDDRGFYFGDGVYEVVRVVNGRVFEAAAHGARLEASLKAIGIDPPRTLMGGGMTELCHALVETNGHTEEHATVYLQVTRGSAPRTHGFPPAGTPPTVFASSSPFQIPRRLREEGVEAITTPDIRWTRCDIKSVNLLANVLAKQAAVEAGAFEALLIRDGILTEGASSNIFGVVDGVLRTHPLCNLILGGITRTVVLELAAGAGLRVVEEPLRQDELSSVNELFATGTTTDVQPIVRVDGQQVGDGTPGPITRLLQEGLERRMEA